MHWSNGLYQRSAHMKSLKSLTFDFVCCMLISGCEKPILNAKVVKNVDTLLHDNNNHLTAIYPGQPG